MASKRGEESGATAFCSESNQEGTNILVVKGTTYTGMKDVCTKAIVIIPASLGVGCLKKSLKVAGTPIFAFFYYLISSYQVTKTISTLYRIFMIIVGVL